MSLKQKREKIKLSDENERKTANFISSIAVLVNHDTGTPYEEAKQAPIMQDFEEYLRQEFLKKEQREAEKRAKKRKWF